MDYLFLQIRFIYLLNMCHLLKAGYALCLPENVNKFFRKHLI